MQELLDRARLVRCADVVVRRRNQRTLSGVSLQLGAGVVALAGANGSGKSTLLQCLTGLLPVEAGSIAVGGHDVASAPGRRAARRVFGFLPQRADFPGSFTVEESVAYGGWLHRAPLDGDAVAAAIERVGLTADRRKKLSELSGGMRQRALLAQVTVHTPPIVLLDEPTVGLDAEHRHALRQFLADHAAAGSNNLVVFSTHLPDDIAAADRVIVLARGAVAFDGSPLGLAATAGGELDGEVSIEVALRTLDAVDRCSA